MGVGDNRIGKDTTLSAGFWSLIESIVTVLLIVGVGVTIYAAKITEEFEFFAPHTWRKPRPTSDWLQVKPGPENEAFDDPALE